jgi:tetratricopeptide (TPR) repeat protein
MLDHIGGIYYLLGEKQKALDFYNQELPLRRAVGDSNKEAKTLNNIGDVYDSLGEKQKALDFHNQAAEVSARSRRPF